MSLGTINVISLCKQNQIQTKFPWNSFADVSLELFIRTVTLRDTRFDVKLKSKHLLDSTCFVKFIKKNATTNFSVDKPLIAKAASISYASDIKLVKRQRRNIPIKLSPLVCFSLSSRHLSVMQLDFWIVNPIMKNSGKCFLWCDRHCSSLERKMLFFLFFQTWKILCFIFSYSFSEKGIWQCHECIPVSFPFFFLF